MKIRTLTRLAATAVLGVAFLLVVADVRSLSLQTRTEEAGERLQRLTLLGAQMRLSSNELTRLARSHVVLGDRRFRARYEEVLAVRAGRRPRPDDYQLSDWNIERPPLRGGSPRSLLSLLRAEDVPDSTFALLEEALAESERLAVIEIAAMDETDALIARGETSMTTRGHLVTRLHDEAYRASKARIMRSIDRFEEAVRAGAARDLRALQEQQRAMLALGVGVVVLMLIGFVWFERYTNRSVLVPLERLGDAAERVSRADYRARANVEAPNELGTLAIVFNRMAAAIESDIAERERLSRELEALARVDPLTGLPNRRAFRESAGAELARVRRFDRPVAVLMVDVDRFKRINDDLGHAVGDEVLQKLGMLLREQIREVDVVGRLGGEEFAILLPELGREGAGVVAERLRSRVAACDAVKSDQGTVRFSVSIGMAVLDEPDVSLDELLRRADSALYQAKREGRNRVNLWVAGSTDRPSSPGIKLA